MMYVPERAQRTLAESVVLNAARDAATDRAGLEWFTTDDADLWCEMAGVSADRLHMLLLANYETVQYRFAHRLVQVWWL